MDTLADTVSTLANYTDLLDKERAMGESLKLLDKAEQCGMECQQLRAAHRQVMERIAAIKQHFFTPPPTR